MGFTLYLIDISGVVLLAGSCRDDPESNLASLIALDLPGVSVEPSLDESCCLLTLREVQIHKIYILKMCFFRIGYVSPCKHWQLALHVYH